jgi:hypothetical protein
VLTTVGKNTPNAIVATFDGSPMPNHRMNNGRSAIFGTGKSAAVSAMPSARATLNMPIAKPSARPAVVPKIQPIKMRPSDAATCSMSLPLISSL